MRLRAALPVTLVLLHLARSPDVILLPRPVQEAWPVPILHVPTADLTLVEATVMEGWRTTSTVVTAEEVRSDRFLWQEMFFRNWDALPAALREEGLTALHRRYRRVLAGPQSWSTMDTADWDRVPQPMRAMAVLAMIDCWQDHYRAGERHGLATKDVASRMKAIAMSESWFVHRAESENADGSRDLGIGQTSAATRSRIRILYVRGESDFGLADDDYLDPWKATRALVYWFSLQLDEVSGDLELATRAYNVGVEGARSGRGARYLAAVRRRERDYERGPCPSPTWDWLRKRCPSTCATPSPCRGTFRAPRLPGAR